MNFSSKAKMMGFSSVEKFYYIASEKSPSAFNLSDYCLPSDVLNRLEERCTILCFEIAMDNLNKTMDLLYLKAHGNLIASSYET